MWLIENQAIFQGKPRSLSSVSTDANHLIERCLWLRPGKTYLFGRTAAEAGQLVVSHSTVSRKHLTIAVANVEEGDAQRLSSRSRLTIEDLGTKLGTTVNGHKVKGGKYVAAGTELLEVTLGKCPSKFWWFPVVLTLSLTSKELEAQPLVSLQQRFENLDIKILTDYDVEHTTHVVSKKRNTAKGLQALINAKFVVTETFLDAIAQAAQPPKTVEAAEPSDLEADFVRHWPNSMEHLPPRGGEPVQHLDSTYAPDPGRKDVFDGYTFIFYDKTQYNNLLAPITNGCGKAKLRIIRPGEETVQDFVRYIKEVAGEKGLGNFDDGSEGKGVVLVRYLPGKGEFMDWYADFITAVSLRLDHRPIEQNEFLEAILSKDASMLRRPLEEESAPTRSSPDPASNGNKGSQIPSQHADELEPEPEAVSAPRRAAIRRSVRRRFAGFDDDLEMDDDEPSAAKAAEPTQAEWPEIGLFVSQEADLSQTLQAHDAMPSPRKRRASLPPQDSLMEDIAPSVTRFKRQRLQHGGVFTSPEPEPVTEEKTAAAKGKSKRTDTEMDVLAEAARCRDKEEARARAEREDLAQLPDEADLEEIRRLAIVEELKVRVPERTAYSLEQDVADGRWKPQWNGMKDFKRFRRRGESMGRPPARVIVPLTEVKTKEFGVGDNYWLEDEDRRRPPAQAARAAPNRPGDEEKAQAGLIGWTDGEDDGGGAEKNRKSSGISVAAGRWAARATATRSSARRSQHVSASQAASSAAKKTEALAPAAPAPAATSQRRAKRPAPEPPAGTRRTKRPHAAEAAPSDDSDDECRFRFGTRR